MSQDLWINQVQQEHETSPEVRVLHAMINDWWSTPGRTATDPVPDWWRPTWDRLEYLCSPVRIAHEAGRRYQSALMEWRYRQE